MEGILSSQTSEGSKPANTLILDFQPPELRDNRSLLFKPPSLALCYGSSSKPTQGVTVRSCYSHALDLLISYN